ncbi:hypothetical protein AMELA_G00000790 [Ameiurus melas]|uniref:Ig-like domain-containing protein n=1 Tax=Ameiurus melas TaxID=219545 RepID=A0A7J6BEU5_AMEME|nr:hypothetical protein AMELA_G00000790 [Ameiurus melas]
MVVGSRKLLLLILLLNITGPSGEKSCWGVTYSTQNICSLIGSSVDIHSYFTFPDHYKVTKVFWFIKKQAGVEPVDVRDDEEYQGRVQYTQISQNTCSLRITNLRERDAQTYRIRFNTVWGYFTSEPGVSLSVTDLKVTVSAWREKYMTLSCITTCTLSNNPTYIWYKNRRRVSECESASCSVAAVGGAVSYSCAVEGLYSLLSPPVYSPKNTRAVVLSSGDTVEGDSVTLSCSSDANPPVLTYSWFKAAADTLLTTDQNYSISNLRSQHSGLYYCTAHNQLGQHTSAPTRLDVKGVQARHIVTLSSQSLCAVTGSTVKFPCTLRPGHSSVTQRQWYRVQSSEGEPRDMSKDPQYSQRVSLSTARSDCEMTVRNVSASDSGLYNFRFKTQSSNWISASSGVHLTVTGPSAEKSCWNVIYSTQNICSLIGSSVDIHSYFTFPDHYKVTKVFWFIKDQAGVEVVDVREDEEFQGQVQYTQISQNTCSLRITNLREKDAQTYRFRFYTDGGNYTGEPGVSLSVTDLKVTVSDWSDQYMTLSCNTTCTLSNNPTYIWYKNRRRVSECESASCSVAAVGGAVSYICAVEGLYSLLSPPVYSPKNTRAVVLSSGDTVEGDSVTLSCSSDANPPVHTYSWFKQRAAADTLLTTGQNYSISNISSQHSGLYYCTAHNQLGQHNSTPTRLDVLANSM